MKFLKHAFLFCCCFLFFFSTLLSLTGCDQSETYANEIGNVDETEPTTIDPVEHSNSSIDSPTLQFICLPYEAAGNNKLQDAVITLSQFLSGEKSPAVSYEIDIAKGEKYLLIADIQLPGYNSDQEIRDLFDDGEIFLALSGTFSADSSSYISSLTCSAKIAKSYNKKSSSHFFLDSSLFEKNADLIGASNKSSVFFCGNIKSSYFLRYLCCALTENAESQSISRLLDNYVYNSTINWYGTDCYIETASETIEPSNRILMIFELVSEYNDYDTHIENAETEGGMSDAESEELEWE